MTIFPLPTDFVGPKDEGPYTQSMKDFLAAVRQLPGAGGMPEITIAAGTATPTTGLHPVDTEGGASIDQLDNLDQSNLPDGALLMIRSVTLGRTVEVRHGQGGGGEIVLQQERSFFLDDPAKWLMLVRTGTQWQEVAASQRNAGTIVMWGGNANPAPAGYLICDGRAVSRETYAALHAVLKDAGGSGAYLYGNGDGATTFNLPDLRGRFPLGVNHANLPSGRAGSYAVRDEGATGGEEEHTLAQSALPWHSHGTGDAGHPRFLFTDSAGNGRGNTSSTGSGVLGFSNSSQTFDSASATGGTGGDAAHNNMPPFQAVNFLIKV